MAVLSHLLVAEIHVRFKGGHRQQVLVCQGTIHSIPLTTEKEGSTVRTRGTDTSAWTQQSLRLRHSLFWRTTSARQFSVGLSEGR